MVAMVTVCHWYGNEPAVTCEWRVSRDGASVCVVMTWMWLQSMDTITCHSKRRSYILQSSRLLNGTGVHFRARIGQQRAPCLLGVDRCCYSNRLRCAHDHVASSSSAQFTLSDEVWRMFDRKLSSYSITSAPKAVRILHILFCCSKAKNYHHKLIWKRFKFESIINENQHLYWAAFHLLIHHQFQLYCLF